MGSGIISKVMLHINGGSQHNELQLTGPRASISPAIRPFWGHIEWHRQAMARRQQA